MEGLTADGLRQTVLSGRGVRAKLEGANVTKVLSYYELGRIWSVREYAKGAVASPKVLVACERGKFLLKQRGKGVKHPERVAFAHDLQIYLRRNGYPVPGIVGIKGSNNSILRVGEDVFELFEYVEGNRYGHGVRETMAAGEALGRLHVLLEGFESEFKSPAGSYHASQDVLAQLSRLEGAVLKAEPGLNERDRMGLKFLIHKLLEFYRGAAKRVNQVGATAMRQGMIHGDWHPGNVVYAGVEANGRLRCVLDFDAVRMGYPVADLANGLLQFSMLGRGKLLRNWPVNLDEKRFYGFLRGYEKQGRVLSLEEMSVLPWLMVEALIAEAAGPIAKTGRFGDLLGSSFLVMIYGKVKWLVAHGEGLVRG